MNAIVFMMISVSIFLGALALMGLIWAIKNKQFEDHGKFLDGTKFDDEDALNDAAMLEKRKKDTNQ